MSRRPHRTNFGNHFNEGARRLWKCLASNDESQTLLASEIGVSVGVLSRWLYGDRKPSRESASKIEARLGIPATAWDAKAKRGFSLPAVLHASLDAQKRSA